MNDVYILNKNLKTIGIIDTYKSLIWANRYNEVGDCELYVPATSEALTMLKKNYYIARLDDDMVCQIKKIELDTDVENGNYLIVSGYDMKRLLDQRIVWNTMTSDGNAESFIRDIVNSSLGDTTEERQIVNENGNRIFYLGSSAGFTEALTEQVSYKNVGEKVREYCKKYGWGYRVIFSTNRFLFQLYKGTDRADTVIFSSDFENLSTTKYIEDDTHLGNVALVAGEGEGSSRSRDTSGSADGIDRFELYVDAKDISKTITYGDLTKTYPLVEDGGRGRIISEGGKYVYQMIDIDIQIIDEAQLARLHAEYPDAVEYYINGNLYLKTPLVVIADLPSSAPEDSDSVVLRDVIYSVYLLTRGYERLAEFGAVTSFEGTIEPSTTFVYKKDYSLGDIVTIESDYGVTVEARIVEVVEVSDDNGYKVEPKFEYIQEG